jgi:hypothetical protein
VESYSKMTRPTFVLSKTRSYAFVFTGGAFRVHHVRLTKGVSRISRQPLKCPQPHPAGGGRGKTCIWRSDRGHGDGLAIQARRVAAHRAAPRLEIEPSRSLFRLRSWPLWDMWDIGRNSHRNLSAHGRATISASPQDARAQTLTNAHNSSGMQACPKRCAAMRGNACVVRAIAEADSLCRRLRSILRCRRSHAGAVAASPRIRYSDASHDPRRIRAAVDPRRPAAGLSSPR